MNIKTTILLYTCILLLSCKKESALYLKPFDSDHPITYEVAGDSVTVHRHYNSRVKIDPATMKQIPLKYRVFPPITFNCNDTLLFDSVQALVDSFNQTMVENCLFSKLEPINIVADDTVLFEDLFNKIIQPITERSVRRFVIDTLSLTIKNRIFNDVSTIYFSDGIPYISYDSYGFDEQLTAAHLKQLDTLYKTIQKALKSNRSFTSFFSKSPTSQYLVKTGGKPITVKEICSSLSAVNSKSQLQFMFRSESSGSKSGLSTLVGPEGKAVIGLYTDSEIKIKIDMDTLLNLTAESPFQETYQSYPESKKYKVPAKCFVRTGRNSLIINWPGLDKRFNFFNSGFVVAKYDVIPFLEEKLKILGLNDEERVTFREHWAREIAKNEYSLIHFATDEYAKAVPMTITPEPDTKIRIMMNFKAVDSSYQIEEQMFTPIVRSGFTVVEWGGCSYDKNIKIIRDKDE